MTYKLNPIYENIDSPITLFYPDGTSSEETDGKALVNRTFTEKYEVTLIRAVGDKMEVKLKYAQPYDGNLSFF